MSDAFADEPSDEELAEIETDEALADDGQDDLEDAPADETPGEPESTVDETVEAEPEEAPVPEVLEEIVSAREHLPPRGDVGEEESVRTCEVSLLARPDGTTSILRITGCGIGRHRGYARIWPDDLMHPLDFDGDSHDRELEFVAEAALVVIDESTEIRAGTPGENGKV